MEATTGNPWPVAGVRRVRRRSLQNPSGLDQSRQWFVRRPDPKGLSLIDQCSPLTRTIVGAVIALAQPTSHG